MLTQDAAKRKRSFIRSPSYPSIDLQDAIGRVQVLKDKEGGGHHYMSYMVALEHWGYGPKSSAGLLKLAALKKFGLIENRGSGKAREVKLTDLATKILFYMSNGEAGSDYHKAISVAALTPSIHKELWEKYEGDLPSDKTLKNYLVIGREEGKFSENSVDDFIRQFRTTISFANLTNSDNILGEDEDKNHAIKEDSHMPPAPNIQSKPPQNQPLSADNNPQLFNIPLIFPSGKTGQIQVPFPLTDSEWQQMLGFLEVYRPSLVSKPETTGDNESETGCQ